MPRACCFTLKLFGKVLYLGTRQLGQELGRFRKPSSTLQRRVPPAQLARRPLPTLGRSALSFFVPASVLLQVSKRLSSVRLRSCGGVTPVSTVSGASWERQPVRHFEASPVEGVVHTQVHVADERVGAHTRACLTT